MIGELDVTDTLLTPVGQVKLEKETGSLVGGTEHPLPRLLSEKVNEKLSLGVLALMVRFPKGKAVCSQDLSFLLGSGKLKLRSLVRLLAELHCMLVL